MLCVCFCVKLYNDKNNDHDTNTFLLHFIANAIFDVIQAIAVLVYQKFLHWRFFISFYLSSTWIKKTYAPILYMSIMGSVLGCTFTVVNRYCALCHIVYFREKWTKKLCFKLITLQFFLPIFCYSFNLLFVTDVIYVEYFDFYTFTITNNMASMTNNVILSTSTFIASVITVVLNIIIIQKYNKIMINTSSREKSKRFLMLLYMVVTSLCLVALFIEQFVRLMFGIYNDKNGIYFLTFVLYWIIPTFTLVQPVITLIMSKHLRYYFYNFYFHRVLPRRFAEDKSIVKKTTVTAIKKTTIHI
uniref:Serpentine receptor class gamma n=1 Tax=Parastrongyloides trichosuri TaxID=131310 RepID=A0A0N4ZXL4_PARTI